MQTDVTQSTSTTIVLKVYLSDHLTPATGKTVAITISKNTAAFGNPSAGATNATEIASGWYYVSLSTTDTATLGPLIVLGTCSGCDNADQAYNVKAASVAQTGDSYARLGAPAGASVSADVASVKSSVGAVTGAVGSVTGAVGSVTGAVGSVTGAVGSVTAAVTVSLTQGLSAARALDSIADTSLTLNDALQCAVAGITAQVDASGVTSCVFKTASTGTTLRTKTLTLITPPTTVPDKAI